VPEHDKNCSLRDVGEPVTCRACQLADKAAADTDPGIIRTRQLDALRDLLGLDRRPEPLPTREVAAIKRWLASFALSVARDAELAEACRGLLAAVLSGQSPLDHLAAPRGMTLASRCIGALHGEKPYPGKPMVPPLSDGELERLIRTLGDNRAAAAALVRVLKAAAMGGK